MQNMRAVVRPSSVPGRMNFQGSSSWQFERSGLQPGNASPAPFNAPFRPAFSNAAPILESRGLKRRNRGMRGDRKRGAGIIPAQVVLDKVGDYMVQKLASAASLVLTEMHGKGWKYTEGRILNRRLQEIMPDDVENARRKLGPRGWLRSFANATLDLIEVTVEGKHEPCYALVDYVPQDGSAIPAEDHSECLGSDDLDEIFHPRSDPSELDYSLVASIEETARAALENSEEGWLTGSDLAGFLSMEHPETVEIIKAQLSGKGWLKKTLAIIPGIEPTTVFGKDEPCYRSAFVDVTSVGRPTPDRPFKENRSRNTRYASPHDAAAVPDGLGEAPEPVNIWETELAVPAAEIRELAIFKLSEPGVEFLEGSRLVSLLQETIAEEIKQVKERMLGKGWLKRLLSDDGRIMVCTVPGRREPCYRLSDLGPIGDIYVPESNTSKMRSRAPTRSPNDLSFTNDARFGELAYGGKGVGINRPFSSVNATPIGFKGASGFGKGFSKGFGKDQGSRWIGDINRDPRPMQDGVPRRVASSFLDPQEVKDRLGPDFNDLCDLCVTIMTMEGSFVAGGKLPSLLRELNPDLVDRVKGAMGGKGWLKTILPLDSRIQRVEVEGRDEPCWSLSHFN